MADFHTTLFDTWQPGTTANAEAILFQTPRGGDSTHNERFTNARGAGQLPSEESFLIRKLGVAVDEVIADSELDTAFYGALMEIRLKDKLVFSAPVRWIIAASGWSGFAAQATAADLDSVGPVGDGLLLDPQVQIMGGTRFDVRMVQGAAFGAVQDFKVVLEGILSTPD